MVRLKPLLSFTTDGKGKTDIDYLENDYEQVDLGRNADNSNMDASSGQGQTYDQSQRPTSGPSYHTSGHMRAETLIRTEEHPAERL